MESVGEPPRALILAGMQTQGFDIGNSLYNSIWNTGQFWIPYTRGLADRVVECEGALLYEGQLYLAVKYAIDSRPAEM